jgi:hypothetical protein
VPTDARRIMGDDSISLCTAIATSVVASWGAARPAHPVAKERSQTSQGDGIPDVCPLKGMKPRDCTGRIAKPVFGI